MAKQARPGLSFLDRLLLFAAWLVTCGLVYLFGFYVGKSTQPVTPRPVERVVRLPVTAPPPPPGQRPPDRTELTFYDALGGERAGGTDMPPPGPTAKAGPPAKPDVPAKIDAPPSETAPPAPPATTARPPAPPPASQPSTAAPPRAAPPRAPATSPPPVASGRPSASEWGAGEPAPSPPVPPRASEGGSWSVLANPTRDEGEAQQLVDRLRGRGYDASLVRMTREGDTWYRVRVGRYPTQQRATDMVRQLRERDGVARAFVAED
jgi:cell division septation protein DedD